MKETTEIKWDRYGNPIVYPEQENEKENVSTINLLKRIISIFVLWK